MQNNNSPRRHNQGGGHHHNSNDNTPLAFKKVNAVPLAFKRNAQQHPTMKMDPPQRVYTTQQQAQLVGGGPLPRRRSNSNGPPRRRSNSNDGPRRRPTGDNNGPIKRRPTPEGPKRRPTSDSGSGTSRSKSYADIREAYNIPNTPGTLPPGIKPGGGTIEELRPIRDATDGRGGGGDSDNQYSMGSKSTHVRSNSANGGNNNNNGGNIRRRKSFGSLPQQLHNDGYGTDMSDNKSVGGRSRGGRNVPNRRGTPDGFQNKPNSRRGTVSDGYSSGASYSAGNNPNMARRRTFDAGPPGYQSDPENTINTNINQRRPSTQSGGGGRPNMTSLKPLPENASFRGSFQQFNQELEHEFNKNSQKNHSHRQYQKDLNDMSLVELENELRHHRINMEGGTRNDLMGACDSARRKPRAQQQQQPPANAYMPVRRVRRDGTSTPKRRPSMEETNQRMAMPRRNSFSNVRRRTADNPQQAATSDNGIGMNINTARMRRRSSRESLSSLGVDDLGDDLDEMAVLNAPLGVKLNQNDLHGNPNQQMGMLLQQMQQLEHTMNNKSMPNISAQDPAINRRGSVKGAAAFDAANPRGLVPKNASRRITSDSNHSSGNTWHIGAGVALSANTSARSGISLSNYEGNSMKDVVTNSTHNMSAVSGLNCSARSGVANKKQQPPGPPSDGDVGVKEIGMNGGADAVAVMEDLDEMDKDSLKKWRRKKRFSCTKKSICIGVILVIILGGALAGSIFFALNDPSKSQQPQEGGAPLLATRSPVSSPAAPASILRREPPNDIEGRCAPSNLPGSLSACLSACLPSACCYPNYAPPPSSSNSAEEPLELCIHDKESVDVCNTYRPYCDMFYDTWPGATEGILRSPPQSIVQMCLEDAEFNPAGNETNAAFDDAEDKEEQQEEDDGATIIQNLEGFNTGGEGERPSTENFQRKRLRQRTTLARATIVESQFQICTRHCKAARCCHAPAYAEGLKLSAAGVYTDALRGDHVVTNCQNNFGQNTDLCSEYDQFCHVDSEYGGDGVMNDSWADSWTPRPIDQVAADPSASPSPTLSASPTDVGLLVAWISTPTLSGSTLSPTLSLKPTQSPKPSYEFAPSSFPSHSMPPTTAETESSSVPVVPPAQSLDVAAACSGDENIDLISKGLLSARANCLSACEEGLCCYSQEFGYNSWVPSCYADNEEACLTYYPCLVLVVDKTQAKNDTAAEDTQSNGTIMDGTQANDTAVADGTQTSSTTAVPPEPTDGNMADPSQDGPSIPTQDLSLICSQDSVSTSEGLTICVQSCEPGSCCDVQKEGIASCYFDFSETCDLYKPCTNLATTAEAEPPQQDDSNSNPTVAEEDPTTLPVTQATVPTTTTTEASVAVFVNDPPPAPLEDLTEVCAFEALAGSTASGLQCFEICRPGSCCLDGTCSGQVCELYQPCNNLSLMRDPPKNLNAVCNRDKRTEECESICSSVSCCFKGSFYIDGTFYVDRISSDCIEHFEQNCLTYAQYCAPDPEPVELPAPPADLEGLCVFSKKFCTNVCEVAACCFDNSSFSQKCRDDNPGRCEEYSPCSVLWQ